MNAQSTSVSSHDTHPLIQTRVPERKRITRWGKGAIAGLVAGALSITVEMALVEACGRGNIWDPVRLSASITLGNRAVANTTPFTFDILFIGIMMHAVLSILYAVVLGMLIRKLKPAPATMAGAGFGLLIYLFHFYGLAAVYPWVASWRNWIVVVTHLVFGMSAAWIYVHLHMRQLMRDAGLSPETK
jgi:uncharacterized membrane protein YagU involved in acid resistance